MKKYISYLRVKKCFLIKLTFEEFKTTVLSIRKTLEKSARFYGTLSDKHFYQDGYNYEYYDRFAIRDHVSQSSLGLRYIEHERLLEAGFDAGNMMSLAIGQLQGNTYRVLKGIYTLTPQWIKELADHYLQFFSSQRCKVLHLYHDRSTNQYHRSGKDFATQLKHDIEFDAQGNRSGWTVQLMSVGSGNISHSDEFNLMNILMGEKDKRLPRLLIDQWECKELRSQLELTPVTKSAQGEIQKVKSGEKLPPSRLPRESTNFGEKPAIFSPLQKGKFSRSFHSLSLFYARLFT